MFPAGAIAARAGCQIVPESVIATAAATGPGDGELEAEFSKSVTLSERHSHRATNDGLSWASRGRGGQVIGPSAPGS